MLRVGSHHRTSHLRFVLSRNVPMLSENCTFKCLIIIILFIVCVRSQRTACQTWFFPSSTWSQERNAGHQAWLPVPLPWAAPLSSNWTVLCFETWRLCLSSSDFEVGSVGPFICWSLSLLRFLESRCIYRMSSACCSSWWPGTFYLLTFKEVSYQSGFLCWHRRGKTVEVQRDTWIPSTRDQRSQEDDVLPPQWETIFSLKSRFFSHPSS